MQAKIASVLLFLVLVLLPCLGETQKRQQPLSVDQVEAMLKRGVRTPRMRTLIQQRGVTFTVTQDIRRRLTEAGADAALLRLMAEVAPPPPDPIAALLAQARRQEAANNLTTPAGDNALETYREILRQVQDHPQALSGMRRIKERYVEWARAAERRRDLSRAQEHYQKARTVDPDDERVLAALRQLEALKAPTPDNRPPQIVKRLPEERTVTVEQRESRAFLAEATDPDNDALTYTWSVDGQPVAAAGLHFSFTATEAGTHRISLVVTDQAGLKAEDWWDVRVKPQLAKPLLVMFTPPQRHLSLFLHQFRVFGVQVEVPGSGQPALQYTWTVNGRPVPGKEIFAFRDPSLGRHEVTVTITAPSGASLTHNWLVEVRGLAKNEDLPPLWWPRVRIFDPENIVVSIDNPQPFVTVTSKVQNLDDERSADNVAVWVIIRDKKTGQELSRRLAVPKPQPLGPRQVGRVEIQMPNLDASYTFELISKSRADEDHQRVKAQLLRRAEAARQRADWIEAEALIKTAMKVYPPDEQALEAELRTIQANKMRAPRVTQPAPPPSARGQERPAPSEQ